MAVRGRFAFSFCLGLLPAILASGCVVGSKSFQIDSNSRVPFFGLELKERSPKKDGPSYNTISRSNSSQSRVKTAVQLGSPPASLRLLRPNDRPLAATVGTEIDPQQSSNSASVSANVAAQTSPPSLDVGIPLPMSETQVKSPSQTAATTAIDFH